jgi:hypothetical protein
MMSRWGSSTRMKRRAVDAAVVVVAVGVVSKGIGPAEANAEPGGERAL